MIIMKNIFLIVLTLTFLSSCAQQQSFDITLYAAPKGWQKQSSETAVQFSKEDAKTGTYCMITLMRSVPGSNDSKANFDAAWETVVKEMIAVSTPPEMQDVIRENGWEAQSGYAPFETDGNKGIALLVTSTGFEKMVNILVLTNTDVYEKEMTAFLESIDFKKQNPAANKPETRPEKPVQTTSLAKKDGFTFTTSNFDDGWTSTVQEDWVEVTKGNSKVLVHYPRNETTFPSDPDPLIRTVWDILVANRYSTLRNFKTTYISSYNRPYLGMGYATSNETGKEMYVVLYRQGETGWIEFIEADNNFDPETIQWNSETDLLKPLEKMVFYNKFAVAATDFKGTWTSDFTGIQHLYNVYTGNSAGMNIHQSNQTFQFGAGNTYNWSLVAVNGTVGNTKFVSVKSSGKFTVLNNWQISFSDIEKKPKKYDVYFKCIKGARVLMMNDATYPGSGIFTAYGKK
jgi:hypothetical protein